MACSYLWQVIRGISNYGIIEYYIDKLQHYQAMYVAVIDNKLDIADLLISKGVKYNATDLRFRTPESIHWAKQHNIDIQLNQVQYSNNTDMIKAILSCYSHLLQDIDYTKCGGDVIHYILSHYKPDITYSLVYVICIEGYYNAFVELSKHTDIKKYLPVISISTVDIIDYTLTHCNITIDWFIIDYLFSGPYVYDKVIKYHHSITDMKDILNNGLLGRLYDSRNYKSIIFLGRYYSIYLPSMSSVDTLRITMTNQLDIDANNHHNNKEKCLANKQTILTMNANTVYDLYRKYDTIVYT